MPLMISIKLSKFKQKFLVNPVTTGFFFTYKPCRIRDGETLLAPFIECVKLNKLVIIGVSNRIELWSKSIWDEYVKEQEQLIEEIVAKMIDFDF